MAVRRIRRDSGPCAAANVAMVGRPITGRESWRQRTMGDRSAWLDREYELDLALIREEFARINTGDLGSLRGWFESHPYLTSNDHCRIAGVSLKTVQRWRHALGLPQARRKPPPGWRRPPVVLVAPPDWREGTWLEEQAKHHSVYTIARAIGRSRRTTRGLLRRRGVVSRTSREAVRSKHPCCQRAWLVQHYIRDGRSLSYCAGLAHVSKATMTAWLLDAGIRIRCNGEQQRIRGRAKPEPRASPHAGHV